MENVKESCKNKPLQELIKNYEGHIMIKSIPSTKQTVLYSSDQVQETKIKQALNMPAEAILIRMHNFIQIRGLTNKDDTYEIMKKLREISDDVQLVYCGNKFVVNVRLP